MESYIHDVKENMTQSGRSIHDVVVLPSSSITSYHIYRIKPIPLKPLHVFRDRNNPVHANAMEVKVPYCSSSMAEATLTNADGLTMLSLSRSRVGYVPRALANKFVELLSSGYVSNIIAMYTGTILHLGPVTGRGPQLECFYLLKCNDVEQCLAALSGQYHPSRLVHY